VKEHKDSRRRSPLRPAVVPWPNSPRYWAHGLARKAGDPPVLAESGSRLPCPSPGDAASSSPRRRRRDSQAPVKAGLTPRSCRPRLTSLRVHLTTGGDWWITPEGVPEVPPRTVLRGREDWEAGDTQNTTGSLASRVDRPASRLSTDLGKGRSPEKSRGRRFQIARQAAPSPCRVT
jgi:hypothetical protein